MRKSSAKSAGQKRGGRRLQRGSQRNAPDGVVQRDHPAGESLEPDHLESAAASSVDRRCPHCGEPADASANKCRACGVFLPANTSSVKHGEYSARALAIPKIDPLERLRDEIASFLAQSITDAGGESEITRRAQSQHEYRARLHRRIVQLDNAIEVHGPFDKRGQLRPWLQTLAQLIDKARSLDALLGLGRRQRSAIDVGPEEWAAQHSPATTNTNTEENER